MNVLAATQVDGCVDLRVGSDKVRLDGHRYRRVTKYDDLFEDELVSQPIIKMSAQRNRWSSWVQIPDLEDRYINIRIEVEKWPSLDLKRGWLDQMDRPRGA